MKFIKLALSLVLVTVVLSAFTLKKEKEQVYAFGVSTSFTDDVVYYTNIQMLDSVTLTKQGFLPQRELYTYQLKNYLEYQKGEKNRTCMIYFSEDQAKLDKERTKILNKYKKNKETSLQLITSDEFEFTKPQE
ncbi:hypothetical protein [Bacteroides sp. 519]|uniref:hypothetical protein n=1 Tax=Bacteroides sp. 519 TaxID=2302937 RepID=UPI0013D20521|nr:hypothetical protein [Bacteroides sp. 519]NDV60650.1 hypothetical protein [Bacteroides sp. 519]